MYDPIRGRECYLEEDAFMLKGLVSGSRSTYEVGNPIGHMAAFHINAVVDCWLIGLQQEIAPVIPRSIEWLNKAIAEGESLDSNFETGSLYEAKALALWLQNGDAAVDLWNETRKFNLLAIKDGAYQNKNKTEGLNDYLCYCIQAEQYQAGIVEFEKYYGVKKINIKNTLSPRRYGYAVCLNQITPQFDANDLLTAGRKMLQANLEHSPWLGYGQYDRAAMWLKNVYWHSDRTLTALETVLKAYDNMPNVEKPSFVG